MTARRIILIAISTLIPIENAARGQFPVTISQPAALNSNAGGNTGDDSRPSIACDGQGHWVVVWQSNDSLGGTIDTDFDILVSRSSDSGRTWTPAAALDPGAATDTGEDFNPQVITDGHGHWVAVWESSGSLGGTNGSDYDILVSRSTDNGATWTPPIALNTNAASDMGDDERPQIATDAQGHWVAVWHSDENLNRLTGNDGDILVARSTDNGATWTAPAPLNTDAMTDTAEDSLPRLATDDQGHWVAVWENHGGTFGTDGDILVSRSEDNGATWTPPAPLNTNAATDTGSDTAAQIATDGHGFWIAVWESDENLVGSIGTEGDILVARSTDNGATWTPPAALNANATSDTAEDLGPRVVTDGQGRWVTVWESFGSTSGTIGTDRDILISLSTDNGKTWTSPAPLNTNAESDTGDDELAQIATDQRGNWVVVWDSNDDLGGTIGSDNDILTAHFALPDCNSNGIGDGQDLADGIPDCNANHVPDDCEADTDGDGLIDGCDNCPNTSNPDQADSNGDGIGDACPAGAPTASCGACGAGTASLMALAIPLILMSFQWRRWRRFGRA